MPPKKELLDNVAWLTLAYGKWKLSSGDESPIYVDLRKLPQVPEVFGSLIHALREMVEGKDYDALAAVPTGAIPFVAPLALLSEKPMVWVPSPKQHGNIADEIGSLVPRLQGHAPRMVLLEDTLSTGDSALHCAELIKKAGFEVDVYAIVDRRQGGREALTRAGYGFHALFTLDQLVESASRQSLFTPEQYEEVMAYMEKNRAG